MRIAYMVDAYRAKSGKPFTTNVKPDHTVGRIFTMLADGSHPYMKMWGVIENFHKSNGWDQMCDPELDDIYKRCMSTDGFTINGTTVTVTDMIAARKRWDNALWTRYEFKRHNRHMAGGVFGKLAVLV